MVAGGEAGLGIRDGMLRQKGRAKRSSGRAESRRWERRKGSGVRRAAGVTSLPRQSRDVMGFNGPFLTPDAAILTSSRLGRYHLHVTEHQPRFFCKTIP